MAEKVYSYYRRWQDGAQVVLAGPIVVAIAVASVVAISRVALLIGQMDLPLISPLAAVLGVIVGTVIREVVIAFLEVPITLFVCLAIIILSSVLSFVDMRVGLWSFREIVLTETSISFRRRRPITIQKITNLSPMGRATAKRPEWGLKIEGLTPGGRKVSIKVMRRFGLAKRWQEFKQDLQQYAASTEGE